MGINNCHFSGNLTRDAEVKKGVAALFGLAVNDRRKNPDTGQYEDMPNFINCVLFGKLANILAPRLVKGVKVSIEAHVRTRNYEDKQGNKRTATDFIVENIEIMGMDEKPRAEQPADAYAQEDIPF